MILAIICESLMFVNKAVNTLPVLSLWYLASLYPWFLMKSLMLPNVSRELILAASYIASIIAMIVVSSLTQSIVSNLKSSAVKKNSLSQYFA